MLLSALRCGATDPGTSWLEYECQGLAEIVEGLPLLVTSRPSDPPFLLKTGFVLFNPITPGMEEVIDLFLGHT